MAIRNSAKGIIIKDNNILLAKSVNSLDDMFYGLKEGDIYYDLPGGGQNQFETLQEAVERECLEETGYTVHAERLVGIFEEISINEKFLSAELHKDYTHKIYFIFICTLTDEPIKTPSELDWDFAELEWCDMDSISDIPFYPTMVKSNLKAMLGSKTPLYLGFERIN